MMKKERLFGWLIFVAVTIFCATAICFARHETISIYNQTNLSPNFEIYEDLDFDMDFGFDEEDKTKFIFSFGTNIWEYEVEEFVEFKNNFEINDEIYKYKLKNNKNNKINTLFNLKKLNIDNKTIINYLFPKLNKKINLIKKYIEKPCKNASLNYSIKNNKINIIKEKIGIEINFDLFFEKILNEYSKYNIVKIEVPINKIMPKVMSEDLKKSSNLRASYSTSFTTSTSERKHNIRQASRKINGQIVEVGQTFSFNQVVGRRSEENGYRVAKIISQGEFVDGVGGGVCQVSTTLYNAVLMAGLKIEQANKHSERIYYCKAGFDAMVNYGSSDLIFKNNTNEPIRIYAHCDNEKLYISIFGESLKGYSYKLKSEISDEIPAGADEIIIDNEQKYLDKVEFMDESFYLKKARNGCTIKSFREVYSYGNLVKIEELRTDKYLPQHAIIVYGSKFRPIELENMAMSFNLDNWLIKYVDSYNQIIS